MIRPTVSEDVAALKKVIDRTGLFPSDLLDAMIAPYLSGNDAGEIWLTHDDGAQTGLLYCALERMTEGTWNTLLIAVDPGFHRQGVGSALTAVVEKILQERGAHLLLVETSALPEFEQARQFYRSRRYTQAALIREFYRQGEDKIIFQKALR